MNDKLASHASRRLVRLQRKVAKTVEFRARDEYGRYGPESDGASMATKAALGATVAGGAAYARGRLGNNYGFGQMKQNSAGNVLETARRGAVFAGKDAKRAAGAIADGSRTAVAAGKSAYGSSKVGIAAGSEKIAGLLKRLAKRLR